MSITYATQKFSVLAILWQQNHQQNVTLENYGLLRIPQLSGNIS
ncbi:hypothetical protein [Nostoc sp. UHCC 0251]|nr:hypothetical protein [Nostoc sp. UHCC 0251]